MSTISKSLTDTTIKHAIRDAKGAAKAKKLVDEKGLFLLVKPGGAALWRFRYVLRGKENSISLGSYPDTPLKRAREKRDAERRLIADGKDPSDARKAVKLAQKNSFADVAEEYVKQQEEGLAERTTAKARWQLREFVNPTLGKKPINEITASDLLATLRKIEARGKTETAHKTKELCGRVFLYAIATGRAERNVAADLKGALKPRVVEHFAFIKDPPAVGKLLRAIDGYSRHDRRASACSLCVPTSRRAATGPLGRARFR